MAQQIPCAVCQEVADADYLVTARTEATGWPPGTTIGLCEQCYIGMALAKVAEAQGVAVEPEPGPEPGDQPKSEAEAEPVETWEYSEAEAAHDHG